MKQLLSFLTALLLLAGPALAQTTVTIGTATTNPAGSNTPFSNVLVGPTYTRHAAFYTAGDIQSGGGSLTNGLLKKIRWYKTSSASVNNANQQLRIYIKSGQFNWQFGTNIDWNTELAGATLVYSNNNQNIAAGTGWQEFILQTPYTWTNTNNQSLAIFVEWFNPGPASPTLKWAAPSNILSHYSQSGGGFPAALMNGGADRRPSVQFEFYPIPQNDAGITAVTSPGLSGVAPGVSMPVTVRLNNFGANTITAATINWSVNGTPGTPYAFTGSVASFNTQSVTIGSHAFPAGTNIIKAWTTNPNGVIDPNPANDTTTHQITVCAPLSGAYTINNGSAVTATNFNSIAAAMDRLKTCGLGGPVTFNFVANSGPYTDRIELTNIPGANLANTITINGQGNTFEPPAIFGEASVIKFDSASHITLTNFNIVVNSAGIGFGIHLINHSDHVTISNCTITVPQQPIPSLYGILVGNINSPSTTPRCSNLSILNNTITGGEAGIIINPNSNNQTGTDAAVMLISGNTIKDFRQYGIKFSTLPNALISKNNLSRPARVEPVQFYGIHGSGTNTNCRIEKNRIHNPVGGVQAGWPAAAEDATGIYLSGDAPAGQENLIVNNLIYNLNNSGNTYGIYNNSSDGSYIYHNTISLEKALQVMAPKIVAGFYQNNVATNIRFINNIITMQVPGSAVKSLLFLNSATSVIQTDHNIYWALPFPGGAAPHIATVTNTNYSTLAGWQMNASNPDLSSKHLDPLFTSAASSNFIPTNAGLKNSGMPLAAVTEDFIGTLRHPATPDPGAYEMAVGTGITPENSRFPVRVWPNPFRSELNLSFSDLKPGELKIRICDQAGREVLTLTRKVTTITGNEIINLSHELPAGLYFMTIQNEARTVASKLLKL